MNVGFTGTQRGCTGKQLGELNNLLGGLARASFGITGVRPIFHHGDCIGSDHVANVVARMHGFIIALHPPTNPAKRAFCVADMLYAADEYLVRNHDIVDASIVLVATPGELEEQRRSGTWATIRYARRMRKPHYIIYPNGDIEPMWPEGWLK